MSLNAGRKKAYYQMKGTETMEKRIITIDPGTNGGIAFDNKDTGAVTAIKMPDGMTETFDTLRSIAVENDITQCVMEKAGAHVMGNNASASAKFARHCGQLEMAMYALAVPTVQVTPQKWMRGVFGTTLPKDKRERKNAIKDEMARRYPHLTVTLATADALGIMEYAKKG